MRYAYITALFAWLISHQAVVLFCQNKSVTNSTFLSEQINTNHQQPAKRTSLNHQLNIADRTESKDLS
jgi:hypothetical protein